VFEGSMLLLGTLMLVCDALMSRGYVPGGEVGYIPGGGPCQVPMLLAPPPHIGTNPLPSPLV